MSDAHQIPLGVLMVDVGGFELSADEVKLLLSPAVGGVILFARNYKNKAQLAALTKSIKALRTPQLLIGVDQEGGRVQRFVNGFEKLPPLAHCGRLYDRNRARGLAAATAHAQTMAAELKQVGVDFSFAPVLDCQNESSEVIGDRAFHKDADAVAELAAAYCAGLRAAGMAAVGKHFPGHGGVGADSHTELPTDLRTLDEIAKHDLIPFARLNKKLTGVMTAHIKFSNIDDATVTYSKFWLGKVLRQRLNFTNIIFSDDLSMQGAVDGGKTANRKVDITARCKRALAAGCDIVLICNDFDAAKTAADNLGKEYKLNNIWADKMRASAAAVGNGGD